MGINRKHLYQRTQKCSIFDKSFTQPQYTGGDGGATPHFHTESLIIEGRVLSGNKLSKSTGWSQHLLIIAKCPFTLYSLCSMAKLNGFPGKKLNGKKQKTNKKKNPPANAGDARQAGSFPGWRRSPRGGNGKPLPISLPGELPWTEKPGRLQSVGSPRVGLTK